MTSGWRRGRSGSIFPIRSASPPASTRMPKCPMRCCALGFGFVEVGTVTPMPQPGNPRPRLFRLDADQGVINRLGFNSQGAEAVLKRLAARAPPRFLNRGGREAESSASMSAPTRTRPTASLDYVRLIERFAPVASYVTINISSPNTPGLRNLQQAAVLDDLLARVVDARERVARNAGPTPVLLEDRARSVAVRSRRRCRHRAFAPGRRHDRRQHHGGAAAGAARHNDGQGSGRSVRAAAAIRWPIACWPRPMCGWRASSR